MSEGPPFTDNEDTKNGSEGGKPVKTYAGKKLTPRQKQRLRVGIHQQELNKLNEADGTMEGIKRDQDKKTTAEHPVLESADTQILPEVPTEMVEETAPDPSPYLVEYAHDYDERDSNSIPKTPFQPGPSFSEISDTEVRGTESHYNITKEPSQSIRITGSEEVLQMSHSEGSVARETFPTGEVSIQTVETKADTAPEVMQEEDVSPVQAEGIAPPEVTPESSEPERTESSPSALSEMADPEMEKAIQEFTELEHELATRGVTADNEPSIRKGRKVLEMRAKDTETDPLVVGWHKEQYMRYLQQHISEMKEMVGESTPSARVEDTVDVAPEKVEDAVPDANVSPEKTPTEASPKPTPPAEKEVDTTPKIVKTAIPEKNASEEIELELVPKDAENVPEELTLVPKDDEQAQKESIGVSIEQQSERIGSSERLFATADEDSLRELTDAVAHARVEGKEHDLYSRIMGAWSGETPRILKDVRPVLRQRFGLGRGKPYQSATRAVQDLLNYLEDEAFKAKEVLGNKEVANVVEDTPVFDRLETRESAHEAGDVDNPSTWEAVPMDATLKERPVYEEGDPDDPSTWQVVPIDAKLKKLKVHQEGDPEDPSTWEAVPMDAKLVPRESKKTSESIAEVEQEPDVAPKSETEPQQGPVTEEEATPTPDAPAESAEQVEPADPEALARFHEARNAFKANADAISAARDELDEAIKDLHEEKDENGFVGLFTGTRRVAKEKIEQCEARYLELLDKVPALRNERVAAFRAMRLRDAERATGDRGLTAGERMHAKYMSWYGGVFERTARGHVEQMRKVRYGEQNQQGQAQERPLEGAITPESREGRQRSFMYKVRKGWKKMPLYQKALVGGSLIAVPIAGVGAFLGASLGGAALLGGAAGGRKVVATLVGGTVGVGLGKMAHGALEKRNERLTEEEIQKQRREIERTFGTDAETGPSNQVREVWKGSNRRSKYAMGANIGVAGATGFAAGAGTASAMGAVENMFQGAPDIPAAPPVDRGLVFDSGSPSPEAYTDALPVPPEVVPGADIPGVPPETTSGGNGNVFESGPIDLDAVRDPEPTVTPEVPADLPPAEYAPNLPPAETAPDIVPEVVPDTAPEVAPDIAPEIDPDITPEVVPDIAPEVAPDITPEVAPDIAPEVIIPSSIEVDIEQGGNLWDSLASKLESSGLIAKIDQINALKESGGDWEEALAHRNHLIDELKDHFADMSQQELKDIGFKPNRFGEYNINDVFPGNKIDLTSVLGDSDKFSDAVTNADKVSLRPAATSGIELGGGPATPSPAEVIPTGSETPAPAEWSTQSDELSHLFDQYLNQSPDTGGAEGAATSAIPEVPIAPENPLVDPEVLPDADATVTGEHPDMHPGAEPTPTLEDIMGGNRPETDTSTSIRNATDVTPVEPTVTEALRSEVLQAEQAPTAEGAPAPETATNEEVASTPEGAEESAVAAEEGAGAEEEAAELTNLPPEQSVSENLEQLAEVDWHGVNTLNDFRSIWGELREGINGSPLLSTPVLGRYVQLQSSWGPMSHVRLGDIYDSVDGATFTIEGATHTLVPETEMMLRSIIDATRELPGAEATYELAEREGYSVGDYIKKLHEVRLAQENVSSMNRA